MDSFKAFQGFSWWDEQGFGVIWICLHGRDKFVGDAASLQADQLIHDEIPGKSSPPTSWESALKLLSSYLQVVAVTCISPNFDMQPKTEEEWWLWERESIVYLYLFHCLTHQEAQCPLVSMRKMELADPAALPLTSLLSYDQLHSGHNMFYIDNKSTSTIRLFFLQY